MLTIKYVSKVIQLKLQLFAKYAFLLFSSNSRLGLPANTPLEFVYFYFFYLRSQHQIQNVQAWKTKDKQRNYISESGNDKSNSALQNSTI